MNVNEGRSSGGDKPRGAEPLRWWWWGYAVYAAVLAGLGGYVVVDCGRATAECRRECERGRYCLVEPEGFGYRTQLYGGTMRYKCGSAWEGPR